MKLPGIISFVLFLSLTSCLKKVVGVDGLTTNIYDSTYTGSSWFYIDNAYEYINTLGQPKVKIICIVPPEATPGLKPTVFYVTSIVNSEDLGLISTSKENDERYEFNLDVNNDGSGNYCVSMGVFISEDSSSVNVFTECVSL